MQLYALALAQQADALCTQHPWRHHTTATAETGCKDITTASYDPPDRCQDMLCDTSQHAGGYTLKNSRCIAKGPAAQPPGLGTRDLHLFTAQPRLGVHPSALPLIDNSLAARTSPCSRSSRLMCGMHIHQKHCQVIWQKAPTAHLAPTKCPHSAACCGVLLLMYCARHCTRRHCTQLWSMDRQCQ